jgi:hypothetical protein
VRFAIPGLKISDFEHLAAHGAVPDNSSRDEPI